MNSIKCSSIQCLVKLIKKNDETAESKCVSNIRTFSLMSTTMTTKQIKLTGDTQQVCHNGRPQCTCKHGSVQASAPTGWVAPRVLVQTDKSFHFLCDRGESRSAPQSAFITPGCSALFPQARKSSIHNCWKMHEAFTPTTTTLPLLLPLFITKFHSDDFRAGVGHFVKSQRKVTEVGLQDFTGLGLQDETDLLQKTLSKL